MKVDEMQSGLKLNELVGRHILGQGEDFSHLNYSASTEAAWVVVEKLGLKSFMLERPSGCLWNATFVWNLDEAAATYRTYAHATGGSAPLAICRAALRAIGIDEV